MPKRSPLYRPRHGAGSVAAQQASEREYEQYRGSARERGYNRRWQKARLTFLAREPLCRGCEGEGRVVAATIVDHVEPHRGDSAKFWETGMWQSSCRWHHDVVKQRIEALFDQGKIGAADLWLDSPVALRIAASMRADAC